MKKLLLLAFALLLAIPTEAQQLFNEVKYKRFNFGAKVGMNASFPVVNSLKINDNSIDDITMQYRVGYLVSLFGRINMHRFFIEPGVSWNKREGDMDFTIPSSFLPQTSNGTATTETPDDDVSGVVHLRTNSLDIPVTFGYNVVKEGAYGLSLSVGPVLRYSYDISYDINFANQTHKFTSEDSPFGVGITLGVGVSISRLFFDFTYEFGLNKTESEFSESNNMSADATTSSYNVHLNKRINVMSMSLGFLF